LAVVVDDHLMKISTAVRGTEWMPSFPKHVKLYEFFGWEMPEFVHMPLMLNPNGKGKLSKRFGAMPALSYLRKGYLKDAVLNYVMLCGWAPEPKLAHQDEIYSFDELIQLFDFRRCHKTPARYDQKKLDYINAKHIRNHSNEELSEVVIDWAENLVLKDFITDKYEEHAEWEVELRKQVEKCLPLWKENMDKFKMGIALERERVVVLSELPYSLEFLYVDSFNFTDENWNTKNRTKEELATALEAILPKLDELLGKGIFDHEAWEKVVRGYAEEVEWKAGDLFLAIRSAVTGRLQSPPLLESIEAMGWPKAKKFFEQAIVWLKTK
jgi:glutamyl/glutaminyl-tRNA synthetase